MKNFKKASIGLGLVMATALVAGCSDAGAAESLAEVNAELADVRAQIAAVQAELAARGIDITGIAPETVEALPVGDEAASIDNVAVDLDIEPITMEQLISHSLNLTNWLGQPAVPELTSTQVFSSVMASCMAAKGLPFPEARTYTVPRESRQFAEIYGFDAAAERIFNAARMNKNITEGMSETEANAYWDAQSACGERASALSGLFWNIGDDYSEVRDDLWNVVSAQQNMERDQAFQTSWLTCLANAGFEGWWQPFSMHSMIDWNALNEAQETPIDPAAFANWDWAANPDGPTNPALAEFQENEIALAVANWDCLNQMGAQEMRETINQQIIDAAIAAHGPELQEWLDSYNSAAAAL